MLMGSAIGTCEEVIARLLAQGEKVGASEGAALPPLLGRNICWRSFPKALVRLRCWDRTKEPGALAEPPSGRDERPGRSCQPKGIALACRGSSAGLRPILQEFNPACVQAIFDELALDNPRPRFTVGIFGRRHRLSLPPTLVASVHTSSHLNWRRSSMASAATVSSRRPRTASRSSAITPTSILKGYFSSDSRRQAASPSPIYGWGHGRCNQPIWWTRRTSSAVTSGSSSTCTRWRSGSRRGHILVSSPYDEAEIWGRLPRGAARPARKRPASTPSTPPRLPRLPAWQPHKHRDADGILPAQRHLALEEATWLLKEAIAKELRQQGTGAG